MSKAVAASSLRRAGLPADRIDEALAQVPDPFDLDRDEPALARHGVSCSYLIDSMGGSP
jgi:hypothetical protein